MRIGFTYDAKSDYLALGHSAEEVAEFDSDETIAAIALSLHKLGFTVERIGHVRNLVARLAAGERWELVFNIAEGLHGSAREATIPALLEAYTIPYVFADATCMAVTLDKAIAKQLVAAAGLATAPHAVVRSEDEARQVKLPFPLFVKPLAEGSGKGVFAGSFVTTKRILIKSCSELLGRFRQPVLVETFLSGREFTVGLLGSGDGAGILGVLEVAFKQEASEGFNSFQNKQQDWEEYTLAEDAEAEAAARLALSAWRVLGGRDAGRIDIRSDANGVPHFLEMNPLAGLTAGYSELPILAEKAGITYDMLIEGIMRSALGRYGLAWPQRRHLRRSA